MASLLQMPRTPISEGLRTGQTEWMPAIPIIEEDEPLSEIVHELSQIVKWHFANVEDDDRGIFETRGFACEIVAWRFLALLSKHELIEYLLRELPPVQPRSEGFSDDEEAFMRRPISARMASNDQITERTRLLHHDRTTASSQPKIHEPREDASSQTWTDRTSELADDDPTLSFVGLNALEIASVAGAKRFLSQRVVQEVVNGIWSGDIIFWESLSVHTRKRAQKYQPKKADPYCRLRVPKYQKAFEAAFFAIFLVLYYAVLVERNPRYITIVEVLLYIWIAAFAYDEFGEFKDAGTLFYAADFWSLWDIGIIGIGAAYLIASSSYLGFVMDHAREEYLFHRHWNAKKDQWLKQAGSPKRKMLANRISFSHKATHYSAKRNRSEASLLAKTPGSERRVSFTKDPDVVGELKRVMEKLATQGEMMEKLGRQVEKLAGRTPSREADAAA
ncbi:MAG: hypothetical protein Q9193_003551 [Seirophora villosa]